MKSRKEIAKDKMRFFDAMKKWEITKDDAAWNTMWTIISDISLSLCKKKAYGLVIRDLESKAIDAATLSMDLIKRGKGPKVGLIVWCGYQVTRVLYGRDQKEIDREYSFNEIDEDNTDFIDWEAENTYLEKLCPTEKWHKIENTDYYIGEY